MESSFNKVADLKADMRMRFFLRMYDFGVKKQFEGIHRSTFDLTNQRYFWCIFTMHRRHLWEKKNNFIILWYKNRHRRLNNSSKTFFKSMEIYSFFETENVVWIFSQFNIMLPISFQVVFKFFAVNIDSFARYCNCFRQKRRKKGAYPYCGSHDFV